MSTFRDSILADIDDARTILTDLGLRENRVFLRRRTWSGGQLGVGTAADLDTALSPQPLVKWAAKPRPELGGLRPNHDRILTKLSRQLDVADLTGAPLAAGQELLWVIDDVEHVLFETPENRRWDYTCQVTPVSATVFAEISTPTSAPSVDSASGAITPSLQTTIVRAIRRGITVNEVEDAGGAYEVGDEVLVVLATGLSTTPTTDSAVAIGSEQWDVVNVDTDTTGISHTLTIRKTA